MPSSYAYDEAFLEDGIHLRFKFKWEEEKEEEDKIERQSGMRRERGYIKQKKRNIYI